MIIKLAESTYEKAKKELDLIGMTANNKDKMNREMRKNILDMVKTFSKQGHSGFSAAYSLGILSKLLHHKPLTPLTGKSREWKDCSKESSCKPGDKFYQNKRAYNVFKKIKNGKVTYSDVNDVKRFTNKDGVSYTIHNKNPKVIKFPYTPLEEK